MLICVKDMVRLLLNERGPGPVETARIPTVAPTEVPSSAINLAGEDDINANTVRNVLSNLSE